MVSKKKVICFLIIGHMAFDLRENFGLSCGLAILNILKCMYKGCVP